jgi:hypothetical protein
MFEFLKVRTKAVKPKPGPVEPDWQELYTQALANVRYIGAALNTARGQLQSLIQNGARQNRHRIKAVETYIVWLERKLEEESCDLEYFTQRAKNSEKKPH